jgi:hypothetical protein
MSFPQPSMDHKSAISVFTPPDASHWFAAFNEASVYAKAGFGPTKSTHATRSKK